MHLTHFPAMVLFSTSIQDPENEEKAMVCVVYKNDHVNCLKISLNPSVEGLGETEIDMHRSPTRAFDMGAECNAWFSERFGYNVVLAYLGENSREVLGNLSPAASQDDWTLSPWLPLETLKNTFFGNLPKADDGITFADCAPYLLVSETSMKDVNSRLPEDDRIDIVRFRPNIVISGVAAEYEEDFWAELSIGKDMRIILTQNCARCRSINIDYNTGEPGKSESGKALQKLMKDRRVDAGTKYSPIFGRYGFLRASSRGASMRMEVGDEIQILKKNHERTKFGKSKGHAHG